MPRAGSPATGICCALVSVAVGDLPTSHLLTSQHKNVGFSFRVLCSSPAAHSRCSPTEPHPREAAQGWTRMGQSGDAPRPCRPLGITGGHSWQAQPSPEHWTGELWGAPSRLSHSSALCVRLRVGGLPELPLCPLCHGCGATAPGVTMARVSPWLQHPWEDGGKDFGC